MNINSNGTNAFLYVLQSALHGNHVVEGVFHKAALADAYGTMFRSKMG